MPRHVIMTADVEIENSRVTLEVTDAEEKDGHVPASHTEIPGCDAQVLAAIGQRRDGSYKGVRFRPGVGSADFTEELSSVLWCRWKRMADFFDNNYGKPEEYSLAFIGPVRTGGAGDTQWRIDTAAGAATSADLTREAVREFVELGIAEPELDEDGRSVGLAGYGHPRFVEALAPYQGTIDERLAEEWGAMDASLASTFEYEISPIELPIRDVLVGSNMPLVIAANRGLKSVGALEFILTVERRFNDRQVAVVDIEAIHDKSGVITGFLNRDVKLIAVRSGCFPMIIGLNPHGGVNEHGLNFPLAANTAPFVLNTKSSAALAAAEIWNG